jgi:hypothetical protein
MLGMVCMPLISVQGCLGYIARLCLKTKQNPTATATITKSTVDYMCGTWLWVIFICFFLLLCNFWNFCYGHRKLRWTQQGFDSGKAEVTRHLCDHMVSFGAGLWATLQNRKHDQICKFQTGKGASCLLGKVRLLV